MVLVQCFVHQGTRVPFANDEPVPDDVLMKHVKIHWPLLLGPLSTLAMYGLYLALGQLGVAEPSPAPEFLARKIMEPAAVVMLSLAWLIVLTYALMQRDRFMVLLTAGLSLLLFRELHFESIAILKKASELGVYVGLPAVTILGYIWRDKVTASPAWPRIKNWMLAAFVTYLYSVILSRRAFRFLPYEEEMHILFEETGETVGHLLVLYFSVRAWLSKK